MNPLGDWVTNTQVILLLFSNSQDLMPPAVRQIYCSFRFGQFDKSADSHSKTGPQVLLD